MRDGGGRKGRSKEGTGSASRSPGGSSRTGSSTAGPRPPGGSGERGVINPPNTERHRRRRGPGGLTGAARGEAAAGEHEAAPHLFHLAGHVLELLLVVQQRAELLQAQRLQAPRVQRHPGPAPGPAPVPAPAPDRKCRRGLAPTRRAPPSAPPAGGACRGVPRGLRGGRRALVDGTKGGWGGGSRWLSGPGLGRAAVRGLWVKRLHGQSPAQSELCVLRSREALGACGIPRDQSRSH